MALEDEKKPLITNTTVDISVAVIVLSAILSLLAAYLGTLSSGYQSFLEWWYSTRWTGFRIALMAIFLLLDALLIGFIIFVLRQYYRLIESHAQASKETTVAAPAEEIRENWIQIEGLAQSQSPSDWNMAVLRADALLNDILRDRGYEGTTMAERLKIVDPTTLPSLDEVWSAHRLRNMIAHDPLEQHTRETIMAALRSYKRALKDLGLLEETATSSPPPKVS